MRTAIVAYVPVIHSGYIKLFKKYPDTLYILGENLLAELPRIERDLRALSPEEAKKAAAALGIFSEVRVIEKDNIDKADYEFIMPDEDIMHTIAEKYFSKDKVIFENIFLRWDRVIPTKEISPSPSRKISHEEFDREVMKKANSESEKSPDWWRQIGAIIIKDSKIILQGHNKHLPSERTTMFQGDPRSNFDAGERIEISSALHGEAGLIALAAKKGISLEGTSIYVTVFPCPNCAKLIAASGIKKVFYSKGYSLLDAEDIFESFGVELIKVD
jgi:dCMP deaminase